MLLKNLKHMNKLLFLTPFYPEKPYLSPHGSTNRNGNKRLTNV